VGSILEAEEERGIAHMIEHLAFRASKDSTENFQLVKKLESYGIAFGAHQVKGQVMVVVVVVVGGGEGGPAAAMLQSILTECRICLMGGCLRDDSVPPPSSSSSS